jgi:hypothetical protein
MKWLIIAIICFIGAAVIIASMIYDLFNAVITGK